MMLLNVLLVLTPLLGLSQAHIQMNSVNGNAQAVRKVNGQGPNFPIFNPQSADMVCGIQASPAAAAVLPVAAGAKVTTKWFHNGDTPNDQIIDPSHKGPCNFYMAKLEEGQSLPTGAAWFKIFESGFSNGNWCTDKLIAARGLWDVTIPANIAPGKYLLRGEINALHEADRPNGAQFYVFCAELQVSGGGNAEPTPKTVMPYLTATSPGVRFDVYNSPGSSYPTLGIPVATFGAGGGAAPAPAPAPPAGNTTTPATPAPAPPAAPPAAPAPAPPAAPAPAPPTTPPPAQCVPYSRKRGLTTPQSFASGSITTKGIEYCFTNAGKVTGVINFTLSPTATASMSSFTATFEGIKGLALGTSWNAVAGSVKLVGANSLSFSVDGAEKSVVGMMVTLDGVECGANNQLVTPVTLSVKEGAARR
ncbi:hypothetical protein HDV05_002642 [Chytridiales sp. JEL 0842]|nr:hypothetical protein HDV05_002642 [Chytridiales sp. JEL 0842]